MCVYMHESTCACVHACMMYIRMRTGLQRPEKDIRYLALPFLLEASFFLLNLELGWWPSSPRDPLSSVSHGARITGLGNRLMCICHIRLSMWVLRIRTQILMLV